MLSLACKGAIVTDIKIALSDLPLFWEARARALRLLIAARNDRSPIYDGTLGTAETYEECVKELKEALAAAKGAGQ